MTAPDLFIVDNPAAGHGRGRRAGRKLRHHLQQQGIRFEWTETRGPDHAAELVAGVTSSDFGRLVLIGGDGTLADSLPGLIDRKDAPPILLIPAGTGNDYASTLGIRGLSPIAAFDAGLSGEVVSLDVGSVDGRPFLNGLGLGLDGEVAARARRIPLRLGLPTYLAALALTLPSYRPFAYRIELDDEVLEGVSTLLALAHGPTCGGGFRLTPKADPTDGRLDLCLIGAVSRTTILVKLPLAVSGHHLNDPLTTYRQVRRARIELDRAVAGHVDGNLLPPTRETTVAVRAGAVRACRAAAAHG